MRIQRRGFTLVELLVVIGLLAILATLVAIYITPSFRDNKNVIRGLDRVTTTLLIAKQRALRDQGLRGVRLLADANGIVKELQYIEQPEAYTTGQITSITPLTGVAERTVTFSGVDFVGGAAQGDTANYNVAPGDYFRSISPAWVVRISRVPGPNQLVLPDYTPDIVQVPTWQILRAPRPISGEDTVALPDNVVIDMRKVSAGGIVPDTNRVPGDLADRTFDILFDPAGGLVRSGSATLVVWVRDATVEQPLVERDRSRLLAINPRTGFVSAHEIAPGNNPVLFATDGKSSGL